MVNREVGEWWPLLTRDGNTRIWTHMGHSWKINYHSVRAMIQSINRLDRLLAG
jgi:mannobiose 2-epimerase